MKIHRMFSEADLQAIQEATAAAELRTSGEIVPYIVDRVDGHDEARWCGATLGALFFSLAAAAVNAQIGLWGGPHLWWIALPPLIGGGLGYALAGLDSIARKLIPQDTLEHRVRLRAEAAFLEEEVFKTRDRTGVLVFLALFERRAVILGDEGINQAVPEKEWQRLVDDLVAGIRQKRAAESLCEVIGRCGELLERRDVERREDDTDELDDAPRVKDR